MRNDLYTDSVLCDAAMGSTLCVKANIFPDTLCTPLDTNWDKSSIKVDGYCLNDSLAHFIIYNEGNNMTASSEYRIFINNALSKTQTFQLNSGDSLVIDVVACGKTIRLEADQRPGHPGNSHPRATVENCGTSCAMPSFGFVNGVAEDDEDYFVEIDCQIVRASYDPNEKLVKPEGITANRYVSAKDELEYQINFQNTGNDTAFLIVVRDTLNDNTVDIGSVVSGASSHPYTFRIYGQGILEWKFQNILLPDSNINEAESHGFVKFKVKQQTNNLKGTVIKNDAGIYFDFNAPVVTNATSVMVFDTTIISGIGQVAVGSGSKRLRVEVFPNPTDGNVVVRITNGHEFANEKLELKIYDLLGREVFFSQLHSPNSQLNLKDLPGGIYFYEVTSDQQSVARGKLLIE